MAALVLPLVLALYSCLCRLGNMKKYRFMHIQSSWVRSCLGARYLLYGNDIDGLV